jgi:hypothetical protein
MVRWEKPRLGIIEYNGSKDNNIFLRGLGCIIKDPEHAESPEELQAKYAKLH